MRNANKLTPEQWQVLATKLMCFGLFCGIVLGVVATLLWRGV